MLKTPNKQQDELLSLRNNDARREQRLYAHPLTGRSSKSRRTP